MSYIDQINYYLLPRGFEKDIPSVSGKWTYSWSKGWSTIDIYIEGKIVHFWFSDNNYNYVHSGSCYYRRINKVIARWLPKIIGH